MEVTGIILAGGKSSRMGTDKGLQELCGKPLISYSIQVLSELCNTIIISTSSDAYQLFGYKTVADEIPGIGPMGGIYSALKQSKTEKNLVLSCDLPFVSKELMSYILKNSEGYQVAVPWEGDQHYEPLCGFYHLSILDQMNVFIKNNNYKLPDVFEKISINRLVINKESDFYTEELFLNVNSKHDLAAAENLMHNRK
ncbi:MAG: molybdenum cofactor guanylyltransferase [Bacteroidales bacterium]|nr:molybdenum cofactor guanylyltransferase [Bacteroidales bacterium]